MCNWNGNNKQLARICKRTSSKIDKINDNPAKGRINIWILLDIDNKIINVIEIYLPLAKLKWIKFD